MQFKRHLSLRLKSYLNLPTFYKHHCTHFNIKEPYGTSNLKSVQLFRNPSSLHKWELTWPRFRNCPTSWYKIEAVVKSPMNSKSQLVLLPEHCRLQKGNTKWGSIMCAWCEGFVLAFLFKHWPPRVHNKILTVVFLLWTLADHHRLLLNEQQTIPSHSLAHVQHYALTLAVYEYTLAAKELRPIKQITAQRKYCFYTSTCYLKFILKVGGLTIVHKMI